MAPVRIGVTGHRSFRDVPSVVVALDAVLDRVIGEDTATVISSLAEGGDRLVADRVLARGPHRLEVVLPLPPAEYADDFTTPSAAAEFTELLARAATVEVVDAGGDGTREDAYERAGRTVVDRSDVVVALWDGEPARGRAGCAEIVQYALDRDRVVEVVLVERGAI